MLVELFIILLLILVNGIFSGAEIAIVSLRKTRLAELVAEGKPGAWSVAELRAKPEGFLATDISDARLSRQFTSFAQMDQEHKEVRIWGGIHFRNSLETGDAMGRKVADHLVANYMKPTR